MTKRTKRFLVILAAAAAILLVAAAVALAVRQVQGNSYSTQLLRGQKYLDSGQYEEAVLCYRRAVQAADDKAEGYIGLALAYKGMNKLALAQNVLDTGWLKTGSARIQLMMETNFDGAAQKAQTTSAETADAGSQTLDTALLDQIVASTYNDYRLSGKIVSEGTADGVYTVYTDSLTLYFANTTQNSRVIDPNTGHPYSTQKPGRITVNEISVLFGGKQSVTVQDLAGWGIQNAKLNAGDGAGEIRFTYRGCEASIVCNADGQILPGAENSFTPSAQTEEDASDGGLSVSGMVVDAQTGSGVAGASLEFAPRSAGDAITVQSGAGGRYTASVPQGSYTVTVRCQGYRTENYDVNVYTATPQNFTITQELAEGEIRIVLEWGSSPRDLDSHLNGRTADGTSVSVDFTHKVESANGVVLAKLDVDDTDGYGPETTTIYASDGVYEFVVIDFTRSGTMSSSGATVKIYSGNQQPVTVSVCEGLQNTWRVCRINHGEVQIVNTPA